MLAPDGAEVAAQEWDALVVVVVEAIGPLVAVDPGDDKFSFCCGQTCLSLFKIICFLFSDMAPLFALSTDSLWRTFPLESAGR